MHACKLCNGQGEVREAALLARAHQKQHIRQFYQIAGCFMHCFVAFDTRHLQPRSGGTVRHSAALGLTAIGCL